MQSVVAGERAYIRAPAREARLDFDRGCGARTRDTEQGATRSGEKCRLNGALVMDLLAHRHLQVYAVLNPSSMCDMGRFFCWSVKLSRSFS